MRSICLLGVLVVAKLLVMTASDLWPPWSLPAFFWQDLAVVIVAGAIDRVAGRPRAGWVVYAAAVLYIALNAAVTRVLGTPLTWNLMRAARGPLADSIAIYLTPANIAVMASVGAAGLALPLAFARWRSHVPMPAVMATAVLAVVGSVTANHVDTRGYDRNAFTALVPIGLPSVRAASPERDWRASPVGAAVPPSPNLDHLRGSAGGFNVVIIVLESTAAKWLRSYGAGDDSMPVLTTLGRRALVFENAYAAYPESIKGLFSTLCSRFPAFDVPVERHAAAPCESLAGVLKAAGYQTTLFHSGRFGYLGMEELVAGKGFDVLEDAGAIGGQVRSSFGVEESATVDRMLGWLDSRDTRRPFFMTYLPVAGHHPYVSPVAGPFPPTDVISDYKNALHYADTQIGRLLEGLRARHLADRTMLVVFGDHGEAFDERPGNIGHTLFIYEENVRVPYLIAVPGATNAEMHVPSVASLVDTAPTVLDLLGLPIPSVYEGASLLANQPRMALFFTDYSLGWLGLRDGCSKYLFEVQSKRSKLYDVCRDPGETEDLGIRSPEAVTAYRDRVIRWSASERARLVNADE